MFVEICIVDTHSPFTIFLFYKDWVCQPFWMCDFSDKTSGQEPGYFYPNSLLPILSEAMQPLLDGPCLLVEIQGVLSLLPRYAWHVGGLPCKDVLVGAKEEGEREFLYGVELGPDQGCLAGVVVTEDDRLRLAVEM